MYGPQPGRWLTTELWCVLQVVRVAGSSPSDRDSLRTAPLATAEPLEEVSVPKI